MDEERRPPEGEEPRVPDEVMPPEAQPDALAVARSRGQAIEIFRGEALRATRPEHWTLHKAGNGSMVPRLTSSGADVVARRFGVRITDKEFTRVDWPPDEAGASYSFIYKATFRLPGDLDVIEDVVGEAWSRDQFLGTGTKIDPAEMVRQAYEVKPGDILKKAESNCTQRGVTMLTGLRGLTVETLALYGVRLEGAPAIEYKEGAKGGGRTTWVFPWGRDHKGKPVDDPTVTDKDLEYYLGQFEASLADESKKKYRASNDRAVEVIKAEQVRRANLKAGTTAKPAADAGAPAPAATPYARILAIAKECHVPEQEIARTIRAWTGKTSSLQLNDADVATFAAKAKEAAASDDVQFPGDEPAEAKP